MSQVEYPFRRGGKRESGRGKRVDVLVAVEKLNYKYTIYQSSLLRSIKAGKAHGNVTTSHKKIYNKNFGNDVQKSIARSSKEAMPMTQEDIRLIRKFLELQ